MNRVNINETTTNGIASERTAWSAARRWSMALRSIYLALIIASILSGQWSMAAFHAIIFIGTLFIPILGWRERDDAYYRLDAVTCAIFASSIIVSFFSLWPQANPYYGFDKIFHAGAGAVLAWFATIYLRKHTTKPLIIYGGAVLFVLAVGGAWEVFEWVFSILPPPFMMESAGYADTMLDLVADTLGGTALALIFWQRAKR